MSVIAIAHLYFRIGELNITMFCHKSSVLKLSFLKILSKSKLMHQCINIFSSTMKNHLLFHNV